MTRIIITAKLFMAALVAGFGFLSLLPLAAATVDERVRMAYISDSPGSSAPYWIAKEAGFYKKYGLETELIFINGSTRGIQSLVAGDIEFAGAVGTSAINGKLAGGDIVIVDSLVNTLPYYIIGRPDIKSPEDLKGRTYKDLLDEDTYPTLEGLRDTLAVQASWDPKAANSNLEDFVDLRFVNQLRKAGFIDQLYGQVGLRRN